MFVQNGAGRSPARPTANAPLPGRNEENEMPTWTTRSLALASIAALPLALGPAAWAQTETDADTDTEVETEVEAEAETDAEMEADPGMDTGAETEPQGTAPSSSGPKRVRVPSSEDTADADAGTEESFSADEAPSAEDPAAEAEEAAAEPETDAVATAADETGAGPFVGDFTIGDPEAPVQVVEYASFTCPHCAAFHQSSWDWLNEEFIEPGRIGFTMRDVFFDRFGLWASMAARCGGEKAFYPLADQYMSKQAEWTKAEDIGLAIASIARRSGLTEPQIKACLENQDFAKMLVETYKANQQEDEVQSTPTFLIHSPDGTVRVVGNKPDEVREAIESALPAG